jgi:hypothetical protein
MAGYRDTSNYDPYASPRYGKPLRPFNWVQWSGVALIVLGIAIELFYLAAEVGFVAKWAPSPAIAVAPLIIGVNLINSRREELTDLAPELAPARKRWLIYTVLACVIIIGAATIIDIARS